MLSMFSGVRPTNTPLDSPMSIVTPQQVADYKRDGYIVLRNCINPDMVTRAVAVLNAGLAVDAHKKTAMGGIIRQAWPAEFASHPDILGLLHQTPVLNSAEELVGCALRPVDKGQIAVRFKKANGRKDFGALFKWHIDGFEKNTTARFASIVLVALSDWTRDNMGNLTVYPGTHSYLAEMMASVSWSEWNKVHMKLDLEQRGFKRKQVHCRAGDVILSHPLMAHDVAVNVTDHPRLAVIFRPGFLDPNFRDNLLQGK